MNTQDVLAAIERYFAPPQWAFLEQVRNGTGWSRWQNRTADALAFSLWPSRGLELWGIEVKVSRGDWLREVKTPEKAEDIGKFCHRFVVAAPKGLIQAGELPPVWGNLEVEGGKALLVVKPELRTDVRPLDMPMLAAIFRRVQESYIREQDVLAQVEKRAAIQVANAQDRAKASHAQLSKLQDEIGAWEQKTGLRGWQWRPDLIEAVKLAVAGQHAPRIGALRRAREVLLTCAQGLEASILELMPPKEEQPDAPDIPE